MAICVRFVYFLPDVVFVQIENDLFDVCHDLLKLIDEYLLESSENDADSQIFYKKMRGDYYRYTLLTQNTSHLQNSRKLVALSPRVLIMIIIVLSFGAN